MKWDSSAYEEKEFTNLKPGIGTFQVKTARETIAKSTNIPMIELECQVWDISGASASCRSYLSSNPKCLFIIKQFCESVEIPFDKDGIEAYEIEGKSGNCELELREWKGAQYISIKKFISARKAKRDSEPPLPPEPDDEIPF